MFSIYKLINKQAGNRLIFGSSRKSRIVSLSALFMAAVAFGAAGVAPMAPDAADLPRTTVALELSLPQLSQQVAALQERSGQFTQEERVRPGDTLATLLKRLGVDDEAAASFIKSDNTARAVMRLKAGKRVQAQTNENGQLLWLRTTLSDARDANTKNLFVRRTDKGFTAGEEAAQLERLVEMKSGVIKSSLFAATDASQIPDQVAMQIVDMFSTDIDFASDLQRGDRFNVVYESFWQDGEFVRTGRILAAEFVNDGHMYQSVWFDEPNSKQGGSYYGFDGKSLKKAFLKSPLEFSRISSGFSMRKHPISGMWKQHKGVDFAAPTGTPIRAAGDGTIEFIGGQGGYGNVVVIKHWNNYSTAYAHMSRFAAGVYRGSKINQGDIIGYVGTTGWSTGPHLHYEFRVNNEPRDPMSVDVPNAQPLAGADLQRFRGVAADMKHRFALLNTNGKDVKLASK